MSWRTLAAFTSATTTAPILTLTAAAVGPVLASGQTNNIIIYSKGNIVLLPQTTNLTKLATSLPVAVFNPGGDLTLSAGTAVDVNGIVESQK